MMEYRRTLFPPLILRTIPTTPASTPPPVILDAGRSADDPVDRGSAQFLNEGWAIALVALTSVRLLVLLFLWIYLSHRTLRMRVSLQRVWLSQLLLASLTLSHAVLYAFVVQPGPVSCTIVRFGVGLSYVMPLAILMLKLILIIAAHKGYDIPKFCQVLLLALFVGIQVALSAQWLTLVPPSVTLTGSGMRTCDISIYAWLGHLGYILLLMVTGTVVSIGTHHIKNNHREAMFVGFAFGFNLPICVVWATTAALLRDRPAMEDKCMAFGLLASTSLILFVMFLPRSRQLVAVGEGGLYTEDTPVVKPISELAVHKLYYPVYHERRSSLGGGTLRTSVTAGEDGRPHDITSDIFNHEEATMATIPRLSSHWYPPLRDTLGPVPRSRPSAYSSHLSRSYQHQAPSTSSVHFDDVTSIQRGRLNGNGLAGGSLSSMPVRCLTPPSEEGSTTPSVQESERASCNDADSDVDMAHFRERNVDGVSYIQVSRQQPMY